MLQFAPGTDTSPMGVQHHDFWEKSGSSRGASTISAWTGRLSPACMPAGHPECPMAPGAQSTAAAHSKSGTIAIPPRTVRTGAQGPSQDVPTPSNPADSPFIRLVPSSRLILRRKSLLRRMSTSVPSSKRYSSSWTLASSQTRLWYTRAIRDRSLPREQLPRFDISNRQNDGDRKEVSTCKQREFTHSVGQKW